jgi:putative ABC transport system permease protein
MRPPRRSEAIVSDLFRDIRYALRVLTRNPGYAAAAIVALAVGTGANTAIFSEVNAVLLRPLPYPNSSHLAMVWGSNPKAQQGTDQLPIFGADFTEYQEENKSFDRLAGFRYVRYNLMNEAYPEEIQAANVSAEFFPMLGVQPALGRTFLPEEDQPGRNDVVVLGNELWSRLANSDPNIVGKAILLNGQKRTVIGVMPKGFEFPRAAEMPSYLQFPKSTQLWAPLALNPKEARTHGTRNLAVLAELKPAVTLRQAQSDMDGIAHQLELKYPDSDYGLGVRVVPLQEQLIGRLRPFLLVLWGAVGFVLLIACANVANLQLARSVVRQHEMAVRTALGARRTTIIRQLLTEGVMLGLIGGIFGLLLAEVGVRLISIARPGNLANLDKAHIDGAVLGFTAACALLSGMLSGLTPALVLSVPGFYQSMREKSQSANPSSSRMRNALLVVEVSLAVTLLVGAGLMVKAFLHLQSVDPGFNPENVLTMEFLLPGPQYSEDLQLVRFYQRAMDGIRSLPGIQSVSVVATPPLSGQKLTSKFTIEGQPLIAYSNEQPLANLQLISPEYFKTMQIPLLRGRSFTEHDDEKSTQVAIVNRALANRFWPGQNAEGHRIKIGGPDDSEPWMEIVGIADDVKSSALGAEAKPELYLAYSQNIARLMHIVVRTSGDPMKIAAAVRQQIWSMDKNQPIANIETMKEIVADSVAGSRFTVLLLSIFSGVAFLLAVLGIYGIVAYFASQRTREIGIRRAFGARTSHVLLLVIGQGFFLTLAGTILGLIGARALTRVLSSFLYDVSPTDPAIFVGIAGFFLLISVVASFVPALRAASVNPMEALRYE